MSTKLRPECSSGRSGLPATDEPVFLQKLYGSLLKRRGLTFGRLNKGRGHCAMGCFWADYGTQKVKTELVDKIAAINDAVPLELGSRVRMKIVRNWIQARAKVLGIKLAA